MGLDGINWFWYQIFRVIHEKLAQKWQIPDGMMMNGNLLRFKETPIKEKHQVIIGLKRACLWYEKSLLDNLPKIPTRGGDRMLKMKEAGGQWSLLVIIWKHSERNETIKVIYSLFIPYQIYGIILQAWTLKRQKMQKNYMRPEVKILQYFGE